MLEWDLIVELIDSRLLIVVAACWVVGYGLKRTPFIPDWSILFIVIAVAILLVGSVIGFSAEATIQGILVGAVAVTGHQAVKQAREAFCNDKLH